MALKYIAYYRASTQEQADLFLHEQKDAVAHYLEGEPPLAEYVDIDSSSASNQPELLYAVEHAYRINAFLVVASRNRLSRHKSFFDSLEERRIGVICVDEVADGN